MRPSLLRSARVTLVTVSVAVLAASLVATLSSGYARGDSAVVPGVTTTPLVADVGAQADDDPAGLVAGDQVTLDLLVNNHGPGSAQGVMADIVLPGFGRLVSVVPAAGSCGAAVNRTVACSLGNMAADSDIVIQVTLRMTHAGTFRLTLQDVDATGPDPVSSNNQDRMTLAVGPNTEVVPGVSCTIVGTASGETLDGTPAADTICLLGGADRSNGKGGADRILGGAGEDHLYGGDLSTDTVEGGQDDDTVNVRDGSGGDTADGGGGTDVCKKDAGDTVTGCP